MKIFCTGKFALWIAIALIAGSGTVCAQSKDNAKDQEQKPSKDIQLKEVKVTAQKEFVEYQVDRTVVNVGALISNAGASVLEVLEKSPGVMVDQNGGISLKGQSGVLVMIDNRPRDHL